VSTFGVRTELLPLSDGGNLPRNGHISPMTFAKFQIWEKCEAQVLYVDSDTVTVGGLEAVDLPVDCNLGMVPHENQSVKNDLEVFTSDPRFKFNAGVIYFHRPVKSDLPTLIKTHEPLVWSDQDIFNLEFQHSISYLNSSLNINGFRIARHDFDVLKPLVLHYLGSWKPWHVPSAWRDDCEAKKCGFAEWYQAERELEQTDFYQAQISEISPFKTKAELSARDNPFWRVLSMSQSKHYLQGVTRFLLTSIGKDKIHPLHSRD
jgi:lipopolysaccharide biosynthesis glycosyltransferase